MQPACSCGKPPMYRKSNVALCRKHFIQNIERRVKRTVGRHRMLGRGDRIAFALSGGTDSCVAAYTLHSILKPRRDIKYFAVTLDEGKKHKKRLEKAKRLCRRLGIEHHIFSIKKGFRIDTALHSRKTEKKLGTSAYGGILKKYMLNRIARQIHATKICVGHNMDDEAQAIIMNFLRGDSRKASRLGFITNSSTKKEGGKFFIPRIKPLREISQEEARLYASLMGLPAEKRNWDKGGLRYAVAEFLRKLEVLHPGTKANVLHTYEKMLPYMRKSAAEIEGPIILCRICGEPSSQRICRTCELWRASGQ